MSEPMRCSYCDGEFESHQSYLDHLPCGRMTVADDVQILGCRTLYGGPHPPVEEQKRRRCPHCGERRPKDPCPHCGRP